MALKADLQKEQLLQAQSEAAQAFAISVEDMGITSNDRRGCCCSPTDKGPGQGWTFPSSWKIARSPWKEKLLSQIPVVSSETKPCDKHSWAVVSQSRFFVDSVLGVFCESITKKLF